MIATVTNSGGKFKAKVALFQQSLREAILPRHGELVEKIERGEDLEDAEWDAIAKAVETVAKDFAAEEPPTEKPESDKQAAEEDPRSDTEQPEDEDASVKKGLGDHHEGTIREPCIRLRDLPAILCQCQREASRSSRLALSPSRSQDAGTGLRSAYR